MTRALEKARTTKLKYTKYLRLLPFLRVQFSDVETLETYLGAHAEEHYA